MRLMEQVGIRLIFLFSYNEKYPYANEIWRKTYSVENGYPELSVWNMEKAIKLSRMVKFSKAEKQRLQTDFALKNMHPSWNLFME